MRDTNRIPVVLGAVERAWKQNPHLRLGQLLCNVRADPYYIEDDELVGELGIETEDERRFVDQEPLARREGFAQSLQEAEERLS